MQLLSAEAGINPQDAATAKQIGDMLNRAYPGHLWAINSQWEHGILTIQCLDLPCNYGYVVHLLPTYSSSDLEARCRRGAGEVLERFGLSRGQWKPDEVAALTKDSLGRVHGDLS